jgi:hypothetical protein
MSDTPETDDLARGNHVVPTEWAQKLERERDEWYFKAHENFKFTLDARAERDEARAIADELASIASYCLGWHDHESTDTAKKIASALKRWKKSK